MVSGTTKLDEAVRRTETPNLDLLPVGRFLRNPSELLAGLPLQNLLAELGRRYDAVIVDTPPILSVTDSALVGRWAGVNLLVMRAGQHSIPEIRFGLRRFAQNGVAIRGVIMNDLAAPRRSYYASAGYRPHDAGAAPPPDVVAP
jgi:tyrosine-protein kinase Etk/Wzc